MAPKKKIEEREEIENEKQLDAAAGISKTPSVKPFQTNIQPPPNAQPLLKPDTREKLLYKVACTGTPLGSDFFDNFLDMEETLKLALSISVRLLTVALCNSELAPTQRIAAMRTIIALNGKQLTEEEDDKFKNPPLAVPRGSKEEVASTLERIRQLSEESTRPPQSQGF
jgi:hypothetical protein